MENHAQNNYIQVNLHLILDYFSFKYETKGTERLICCPFHNEKTPSLYANENTFNCFGCGVKGNGISFIAQYLKIDNATAFKRYCELANINYSKTLEFKNNGEKYYDNLNIPEKILRSSAKLLEPTEYLKSRGINDLSKAPIYILNKDFIEAYQEKEIKIYKDAYIIPIYNKHDRLQSIQYITPNNQKFFLNAHPLKNGFCKFFINTDERFFLVEGIWDSLSLNMAGYNAICVFNKDGLVNCALDNFEAWQYKGYVFADNDELGIKQADRASNILSTSVLKSPNEELKDVNDILKVQGVKNLKNLIANFLEGHYLASIKSLIKNQQLKIFYNKFDDKHMVYLFNERLQHQAKSKIGELILNKLQQAKIIFIKSMDVERVSKEIGKYISLYETMIDDENYHPRYKYFEVYSDNDKKYLNLYKPSGLHAKANLTKKPFPIIYEHFVHICGSIEYAQWFIELLAWKWQKPWVKYAYLPIFYGSIGTGKSSVAIILKALFGDNSNKDLTDHDFEDKFNSAFENKLFCIADEVITVENREKAHSKIKALTGSTTFALENKGIRKKNNYNNFSTIILLSNQQYIYKVENNERRAVTFEQMHSPDNWYNERLATITTNTQEDITGELEGFAYYLANLPLKENLKFLETVGKNKVRELSVNYVEEFVDDLSLNYNAVIGEINHLYKMDFPTIDNEGNEVIEREKNGFYIKYDAAKNELSLSNNYFIALVNKKYK
ncbi:DNA primase-like domain protein [Candidatus Hepatincolaceae symbiont of Richtersius coronifer]